MSLALSRIRILKFSELCTVLKMVIALHHVNVTVPTELEAAAKEFYGSVLGLKQVPKPAAARQSGAWYQIGGNQLHLSVEDEANGVLSSRHVCFTVSDLDAAEKLFRAAGVEIIPDPRNRFSAASRSETVKQTCREL